MLLPNFFIVGAPKAGTTSLYTYLDQHPAIYMSPVKEPAFFAAELLEWRRQRGIALAVPSELRTYLDGPMTERRCGVISEWDQYLKLFKKVNQETAVGEASGSYLASISAPGAIYERIPHARIVIMLRDPVDRLFSQHSQALSRGQAPREFLPWVEKERDAVWNGFYARHLERYLGVFPRQQLWIRLYEDFSAAPLKVLRDLFTFLDVDPDVPVDVSYRHNVTLQPRFAQLYKASASLRARLRDVLPQKLMKGLRRATYRRPTQITRVERAKVLEIYDADIRELQRMLKLDLSAWLHW